MNDTRTVSCGAQPFLELEEQIPTPNRPASAVDHSAQAAPSRKGAGGPRTAEGKARSALNNLRHGLAGSFRIIDEESQDMFDSLRNALRDEHQPATATEELLVQRIAEHYWLSRRAQKLQDTAMLLNIPANFSLAIRYQTMHDRGFHRCLTELRKLKKERLEQQQESRNQQPEQQANEFESQPSPEPTSARAEFESQALEPTRIMTLSELISHLRSTGQPLSAIERAGTIAEARRGVNKTVKRTA